MTRWIHESCNIAGLKSLALGVSEGGPKNLVHVENRLGREWLAVLTTAGPQFCIETLEVDDGQPAKRHPAEVGEHVPLRHLPVSKGGRWTKAPLAGRQPSSAHESRQRHSVQSAAACSRSREGRGKSTGGRLVRGGVPAATIATREWVHALVVDGVPTVLTVDDVFHDRFL